MVESYQQVRSHEFWFTEDIIQSRLLELVEKKTKNIEWAKGRLQDQRNETLQRITAEQELQLAAMQALLNEPGGIEKYLVFLRIIYDQAIELENQGLSAQEVANQLVANYETEILKYGWIIGHLEEGPGKGLWEEYLSHNLRHVMGRLRANP